MKRLIDTLIVVLVLLGISGCNKDEDTPITPSPEPQKSNLQEFVTVTRSAGDESCTMEFTKDGSWVIYAGTSIDNIDMTESVATSTGTNVDISGLDAAQRYYFELVFNATEKAYISETLLALEGEDNFRDLGGIVTADGKSLKWGLVFRSGELSDLTEADKNYMQSTGITRLVDFRSEHERLEAPDLIPDGIAVSELPVYDPIFGEDLTTAWLMQGDSLALDTMLVNANRLFVTDFQAEFSSFMKQMEDGNKMVFHCTAGKDRAGFAAVLFLSALGVERETIIDNYLESNQYLAAYIEQTVAYVNSVGLNGELLRPVLGVRQDYIETALNLIDSQYGGMDSYLQTLGVDVDKLKALYLE